MNVAGKNRLINDKLHEFLLNSGLDADAFVETLNQTNNTNISPDMLDAWLRFAFKADDYEKKAGAILAIRTLHLAENKDALRTFKAIKNMAALNVKDGEGKSILRTRQQIAAGAGLFFSGKGALKHYFNLGIRDIFKQGRKLIEVKTESKGRIIPRIRINKKQNRGETIADIVESVLQKFATGDETNVKIRNNLSELFAVNPDIIDTLLKVSHEWISDPNNKQLVAKKIASKQGDKIDEKTYEEAVFTGIMQTLRLATEVGKHPNEIRKISKLLASTMTEKEQEGISSELLREMWKTELVVEASTQGLEQDENEVSSDELEEGKQTEKIGFKDNPKVNLGAAIVSTGLAAWVTRWGKGKTQEVDENGNTVEKKKKLNGWQKTAKFIAITGLAAATGFALYRSGTLQGKDAMSWVERLFDPTDRLKGVSNQPDSPRGH